MLSALFIRNRYSEVISSPLFTRNETSGVGTAIALSVTHEMSIMPKQSRRHRPGVAHPRAAAKPVGVQRGIRVEQVARSLCGACGGSLFLRRLPGQARGKRLLQSALERGGTLRRV